MTRSINGIEVSTFEAKSDRSIDWLLCVSAVFAVGRCLSVRLSVCHISAFYPEDIVKLLCRPSSPIILVFFDPQRRYPIPREPLQRGRYFRRSGKILRLSTEIAVYLGNGSR